jgi:hypothetical protein
MKILKIVETQHMPFRQFVAPRHGRHDWRHARCDVMEYCGTHSNVVEYVQLEKKRPHIMITITAQIKYVVGPCGVAIWECEQLSGCAVVMCEG